MPSLSSFAWAKLQCIGRSTVKSVAATRIETFVRMLEDPVQRNRSITEMAVEAGFSEATQINRHFKKRFGATPTAYRNLYHSAIIGVESCLLDGKK